MDTGAEGGNMVFVKVRETYDLHTVKGKMTTISVHTPKPDIIKANFPGLLMQCKAYRPAACDVRIACASVLPLDPQGVGLAEGDVAPEDVFNPILYKACSNFGMSQIEARINYNSLVAGLSPGDVVDVAGQTADVDVDSVTTLTDEFSIYYGLLSNAHEFRHANPQSGLEMNNLKPLVYEVLCNVGDNAGQGDYPNAPIRGSGGQTLGKITGTLIRGNAKPMPFINCTSYTGASGRQAPGFIVPSAGDVPHMANSEQDVPWINCVVGCIIIPPSRLHELFYRMVVEWTIEFSQIRPFGEINDWTGLGAAGDLTHYQNYSYEATKEAVTGSKDTILTEDTCMVSTTAPIEKVF